MFDWFLKRKLKRLGRHAEPDPAFLRALERQFVMHAKTSRPSSVAWKYAVASLVGVAFLASGTGAYAYSSDSVLPEHPLYPIRESIERVEESAAVTPRLKATVQLRHLARRVHEQKLLRQKRSSVQEQQAARFLQTMERAIQAGETLSPVAQERLDRTIIRLEERFAESTSTTLPERIQTRIQMLPEPRRMIYKNLLERRLEHRLEQMEENRTDLSEGERPTS
jgi:hypothetical protein